MRFRILIVVWLYLRSWYKSRESGKKVPLASMIIGLLSIPIWCLLFVVRGNDPTLAVIVGVTPVVLTLLVVWLTWQRRSQRH